MVFLNDAEVEAVEERIRVAFGKWRERFGLWSWDINLEYERGTLTVDGEPSKGAAACCNAKWEYEHATLRFSLEGVEDLDERGLERVIVHELMHLLLNEMREEGIKHEERVASNLTNCVFWTVDAEGKAE